VKVKNLFNVGVDDTLDQDLRTRVTASNIVFITISLILLIILSLNARSYWARGIPSLQSAFPILLFCVSIGGIFLNHIRWFLTARLVFFLSWTIFITAFPLWRPVSLYGYFLHPMFGIVSSTMVLLMFSFRKEKVFYVLFLLFSVAITVFSFEFVSWFDENGVAETILTYTTIFRLHFYPFLFTVFFNLVLIYVFRINGKFFDLQQKQNETIVSQNKQLSEARLTLELTNNELEIRVRERTMELLEQNNRLKDYAFLHAHVLRAPVGRIRGLLNLMNLPIDPTEEKMVRAMLTQTMQELDDTFHAMNDKLQATAISRKRVL
jgi:signal transduction histidine kinase